MTVDNFHKLEAFLDFSLPNTFYFGFVCSRRKENPDIGADNVIRKYYYFKKPEDIERKKDEIITMCKLFNARFYLNVNRRNYDEVSLECMELLAKRIRTRSCVSNKNIWETASGRCHSEPKGEKKWIIDVDTKDEEYLVNITTFVETLRPHDRDKVIDIFPTLNGYHVITNAFDVKQFCEHPEYDKQMLQQNNPVFIYKYDGEENS